MKNLFADGEQVAHFGPDQKVLPKPCTRYTSGCAGKTRMQVIVIADNFHFVPVIHSPYYHQSLEINIE